MGDRHFPTYQAWTKSLTREQLVEENFFLRQRLVRTMDLIDEIDKDLPALLKRWWKGAPAGMVSPSDSSFVEDHPKRLTPDDLGVYGIEVVNYDHD